MIISSQIRGIGIISPNIIGARQAASKSLNDQQGGWHIQTAIVCECRLRHAYHISESAHHIKIHFWIEDFSENLNPICKRVSLNIRFRRSA